MILSRDIFESYFFIGESWTGDEIGCTGWGGWIEIGGPGINEALWYIVFCGSLFKKVYL